MYCVPEVKYRSQQKTSVETYASDTSSATNLTGFAVAGLILVAVISVAIALAKKGGLALKRGMLQKTAGRNEMPE
jgi:hypothetical protein